MKIPLPYHLTPNTYFQIRRLVMGLARVKIVLVEPAGALNVGSVARVMKNMGLSQLVLVNPQCDPLGEKRGRWQFMA
jgi:hypothetical protein